MRKDSKDATIGRLAQRQHGLVARRQARAAGFTDNEIAGRLSSGRWVGVRPGVFVIYGAPASWERQLRAACLATQDVAVVSDLCAARVWGMRLPAPHAIELSTPAGTQIRLAGISHHRRSSLHPTDLARHQGIPTTTPARTLVDVSGRVLPERLGAVVDDALRRKLVGLETLRRCHQRIDSGPGRRATVAMRDVLATRSAGFDPGGSDWELWVLHTLARAGIPAPVQQHRVTVAGYRYDLDLAFVPERVGLEFDGWEWHGTYTAFHGDRRRTRILAAHGWTMLPVTSHTTANELVRDVEFALNLCGRG